MTAWQRAIPLLVLTSMSLLQARTWHCSHPHHCHASTTACATAAHATAVDVDMSTDTKMCVVCKFNKFATLNSKMYQECLKVLICAQCQSSTSDYRYKYRFTNGIQYVLPDRVKRSKYIPGVSGLRINSRSVPILRISRCSSCCLFFIPFCPLSFCLVFLRLLGSKLRIR